MPDPFLIIVGVIAIACLILYPLRIWQKHRRRYRSEADPDDG